MTRSFALRFTLLIVGVAVVIAVWCSPARRGHASVAAPAVPQASAASEAPLVAPALVGAAGADASLEPAPEVGVVPGPPARAEVAESNDWILGTVIVAGDLPANDEPRVRAVLRGKATRTFFADVARNGDFALAVPGVEVPLELELDSRFLWMSEGVWGARGDTSVVLKPELRACLDGRIVPPRSLASVGALWAQVRVEIQTDEERAFDSAGRPLRTKWFEPRAPDDDGAFSLTQLPVGCSIALSVSNPFGPPWRRTLEPLEPGEARELVVELELGITISGTVVDEDRRPVKGVVIETKRESYDREHELPKSGPSDSEGRFVIARVPRDVTRIGIERGSPASHPDVPIDSTAGDVRDLVLTIERGGCIEGTVVWPDGRAPAQFDVEVWGPEYRSEPGRAGAFKICGLRAGSYTLRARGKHGDVAGSALTSELQPHGPPIALRLEEAKTFELRGVVVDTRGQPVAGSSVYTDMPSTGRDTLSANGRPDGSFVLAGVEAGEWTLDVNADGHRSEHRRVQVGPGPPEPLHIVLDAGSTIRGSVIDATGAPVPDAWVGEADGAFAVTFFGPQGHTSDETGRFEFAATAAHVHLMAMKKGFGSSEVVELDPEPAADIDGVVLRLRESSRVEGRVLDEHGAPLAGARVHFAEALAEHTSVDTDVEGAFTFEDVAPGRVTLVANHAREPGSFASAEVDVKPGRTPVELRFRAPDPVRFHGRVTKAGQGVACRYYAHADHFTVEGESGADGRFELTLGEPGTWRGCVWLASDDPDWDDLSKSDVRELEFVVPDADEHALELSFDGLTRLSSVRELVR